jgi:predicted dehydrogenase
MGHKPVGVAVVGAGYWGPNLIRNFLSSPDAELRWVCDLDAERAARVIGRRSEVRIATELDQVLADPEVEAVAIATPSWTHLPLGLAALRAGKHVLMEKPLATSVEEGEQLVATAAEHGRVLMCDFTFCYTPVVRRLREMISSGELGDVLYIDTVRVNLGLVQDDIDVFWDLGPHDLSILDYILTDRYRPVEIAATGADPLGTGQTCVGYLSLTLATGAIAHVTLNWLSPTKIRQMVISGSKRMALWDDLKVGARLSLYDRGVEITPVVDRDEKRKRMVSYRTGDIVTPALPETEALSAVVSEFANCIREGRTPLTDGKAGLRNLHILEAAGKSLLSGGAPIPLEVNHV